MPNFAVTGVAGYIAPRHLQAIKEVGGSLTAGCDPNDSVGILDRYFPEASFFTEFERFDRHLDKLRRSKDDKAINYLSVCSPNNLHDAHIRLAFRLDADAICEKPLVLNPWNLDALQELELETGKKVYNILQLRVHPALVKLKQELDNAKSDKRHQVELTYMTSRGPWYRYSWKGNEEKSGGVATNIGIHFFDMLSWLFGEVESYKVEQREWNKIGGTLELKNADVKWFLSIDRNDLPDGAKSAGKSTYRRIAMGDTEIEFTEGFTDLHTVIYQEILAGRGFGIAEARPSIELVHNIRQVPLNQNIKLK